MNWDAIGAIGELVGAAAVFISLIYLGVQLRNSKRSDQIIAASQAAGSVDDWIGQIVRDNELLLLYRNGLKDYDSLSPEEKNRFTLLVAQFLRSVETIWFHYNIGTIEPGYWSSIEATIREIIGTSGGRRAFEKVSPVLTAECVALVREVLDRD